MSLVLLTPEELRHLIREAVRDELAAQQPRADLLTTDQAAELAGVGAATIRDWVRAGRLRTSRRGRILRIRRDDLEKCIAGETGELAELLGSLRGGK